MLMFRNCFLFLVFAVFMLAGCTSETSQSTGATNSKPPSAGEASGTTSLDDVISTWQSSKQDEAVKLLIGSGGGDAALDSNSPVLKLSEEDVKSMTRAERTRFMNEAIKVANVLKPLAMRCMTLGDEALGRGEVEAARHYFDAVNSLGRTLQDRRHVWIMQQLGKFLVKVSQERISRCEDSAGKQSPN